MALGLVSPQGRYLHEEKSAGGNADIIRINPSLADNLLPMSRLQLPLTQHCQTIPDRAQRLNSLENGICNRYERGLMSGLNAAIQLYDEALNQLSSSVSHRLPSREKRSFSVR